MWIAHIIVASIDLIIALTYAFCLSIKQYYELLVATCDY